MPLVTIACPADMSLRVPRVAPTAAMVASSRCCSASESAVEVSVTTSMISANAVTRMAIASLVFPFETSLDH